MPVVVSADGSASARSSSAGPRPRAPSKSRVGTTPSWRAQRAADVFSPVVPRSSTPPVRQARSASRSSASRVARAAGQRGTPTVEGFASLADASATMVTQGNLLRAGDAEDRMATIDGVTLGFPSANVASDSAGAANGERGGSAGDGCPSFGKNAVDTGSAPCSTPALAPLVSAASCASKVGVGGFTAAKASLAGDVKDGQQRRTPITLPRTPPRGTSLPQQAPGDAAADESHTDGSMAAESQTRSQYGAVSTATRAALRGDARPRPEVRAGPAVPWPSTLRRSAPSPVKAPKAPSVAEPLAKGSNVDVAASPSTPPVKTEINGSSAAEGAPRSLGAGVRRPPSTTPTGREISTARIADAVSKSRAFAVAKRPGTPSADMEVAMINSGHATEPASRSLALGVPRSASTPPRAERDIAIAAEPTSKCLGVAAARPPSTPPVRKWQRIDDTGARRPSTAPSSADRRSLSSTGADRPASAATVVAATPGRRLQTLAGGRAGTPGKRAPTPLGGQAARRSAKHAWAEESSDEDEEAAELRMFWQQLKSYRSAHRIGVAQDTNRPEEQADATSSSTSAVTAVAQRPAPIAKRTAAPVAPKAIRPHWLASRPRSAATGARPVPGSLCPTPVSNPADTSLPIASADRAAVGVPKDGLAEQIATAVAFATSPRCPGTAIPAVPGHPTAGPTESPFRRKRTPGAILWSWLAELTFPVLCFLSPSCICSLACTFVLLRSSCCIQPLLGSSWRLLVPHLTLCSKSCKAKLERAWLPRVTSLEANSLSSAARQVFLEALDRPYPNDVRALLKLDLRRTRLGAECAQTLVEVVRACRGLRCLDLGQTKLRDPGVECLAQGLVFNPQTDSFCPHPSLTLLCLEENGLTGVCCQSLAALLHHVPLEELRLSRNRIGDGGAEAFATALARAPCAGGYVAPFAHLSKRLGGATRKGATTKLASPVSSRSAKLSGNAAAGLGSGSRGEVRPAMGDDESIAGAGADPARSTTQALLSSCCSSATSHINSAFDLSPIAAPTLGCRIEKLDLSQNGVAAPGLVALVRALAVNRTLRSMDFGGNEELGCSLIASPETTEELQASLKHAVCLRELHLWQCGLGDLAFHLVVGSQPRNLELLNMAMNPLSPALRTQISRQCSPTIRL